MANSMLQTETPSAVESGSQLVLPAARPWMSGRTMGLIISAAILFCILSVREYESFLTRYTLTVTSQEVSLYVLIALAQAFCLVVGGMNLAVGAIASLSTVLLGLCICNFGLSPWLAVPLVLAGGALMGLTHGVLITQLKIDSFIITLSMSFVYRGLRSGISGGQAYQITNHSPDFTWIGQGVFSSVGIPYLFIIMLVALLLVAFMFNSTVFGRQMLATGGNVDAARLSGIKTNSMIIWANVLSGWVSALCAVLWASQMGSATPQAGDNWLMESFAVAIIGGTGLSGGVISILGVFMGGVMYLLIRHGLIVLNANPNFTETFVGVLVLLAIVIDRVREMYSERQRTVVRQSTAPNTQARPTPR